MQNRENIIYLPRDRAEDLRNCHTNVGSNKDDDLSFNFNVSPQFITDMK